MGDNMTTNPASFQALRSYRGDAGDTVSRVEALSLDALTEGELLVRTRWSGVNYKDSLAVTGRARILEGSPRIPGIELVGEVLESDSPGFTPGMMVLVHGFQTGIRYDGGFSEIARVPAGHAVAVPAGLSPFEAAVLGVPGFTAGFTLQRFIDLGLTPDHGAIAISGGMGAVGMLAIGIFKRAGYRVAALTRQAGNAPALQALGADEIIVASDYENANRPLEPARFAAALDNVGGKALSWMLRSLREGGILASVGNAAGNEYSTNVLPFILRNATMIGIQANAPHDVRRQVWSRLGSDWKPDMASLQPHIHELNLSGLPEHCQLQVSGKTSGRTLVRL